MGKNNDFINRQKRLAKEIGDITPQVYAALAISLHRKHRWGYKRINALFQESQEVWNECVQSGTNMLKMCKDETGIDVVRKVSK